MRLYNCKQTLGAALDKFKAVRVHQSSEQTEQILETINVDDLSAGDVTLRVEYSSVNYKDALAANGLGRIIREFPRVPGIDAAGEVVSSDSDRFKLGDQVLVTGFDFGTLHDGGYAEYARVPAEWCVLRPEGMSAFNAMALGTAGFTAALCIQRMEQNGQHPSKGPIVVTGASGGVGSLAIDMLSHKGYEVVAVSSKPEQADYLRALGANEIISFDEVKTTDSPLEKGQWGGAIDNVGGDVLAWLTRTLLPGGNIASVGMAAGSQLRTTVMPFILRGVSLLGITSSGCPPEWRAPIWQRLATDLAPEHLDKTVRQVVSLEELSDIFQQMLHAKTSGRTVVKIQ